MNTTEKLYTGTAAGNSKAANIALAWMRAVADKRDRRKTPAPPYPLLHRTTRHVLLTLGLYLDDAGRCFPSYEELAESTGLSVRTVGDHIRIAEGDGWLKVHKRSGAGQAWALNQYEVVIPSNTTSATVNGQETPSLPSEENNSEGQEAAAGPLASITQEGQERASSPSSRNAVGNALGNALALRVSRKAAAAEGQAADDKRSGNSQQKVRQELPTNSPRNSPLNSPLNSPEEGARERVETFRPKNPQTETAETRIARLRKAITDWPTGTDDQIRLCVTGATPDEVRRARTPPPP